MSLITPDFGLIFWMTLIFAVVFFILAKFGFPMVTGMVDKRSERINESLRLAKEAEVRIAEISQEQKKLIEDANKEQARILKEATDERAKIIAQAKIDASQEAANLIAKARTEIEAEKESALRDIRRQVAMLSVDIAEKVIRKDLAADDESLALVDKMVDEMSKL